MKIAVLFIIISITGCATGTSKYIGPSTRGFLQEKEYTVNKPIAKVWETYVKFSGRKYFTILRNNMNSGVLTLAFGGRQPEKYVDCGKVPDVNPVNMVPYIGKVKMNGTVELVGKIELFMKPIDNENTRINFVVHYNLKIKEGNFPVQTWSFVSNDIPARKVGDRVIECMSTFVAEVDVISGINTTRGGH